VNLAWLRRWSRRLALVSRVRTGAAVLTRHYLAAAWYCSATLAGMRPRSLIAIPWALAQARISLLCSRAEEGRTARRRGARPVSRAWPVKGARSLRSVLACFLLRSIS
jgi:hypothetical protein